MSAEIVPPTLATTRPTTSAAGFLGLGMMGAELAHNLLATGVDLVIHNRTQAKARGLIAEGAVWADSPEEVVNRAGAGIVFTMLSDGRAVKAILFGRNGVARGAPPGTLVVDMSTVDPEESRTFAARLGNRGIRFVDAPVAGSVDAAREGRVLFFVGGAETDLERVRPLLEKMGRGVEHVGPVGAGASMKLVNNLMTAGTVALAAEALSLAEGLGLDRRRTLDLLLMGGGHSVMLENKKASFAERKYTPQFTTSLARKDLRLIERAAARGHRPQRMAREARKLYEEAIREGHSLDDFSSVLEAALARASIPKSASSAADQSSAETVVRPSNLPPGDGTSWEPRST